MIRRSTATGFALLLLVLGCALPPSELEPLPRHPFPRWVQKLETGPGETASDTASVRKRFGEPDEQLQMPTGGRIWRYRFAEVRWPDDDPDRPVVAANGKPGPRPTTALDDVGYALTRFGAWLDWLMFYPPKQPRPASPRWLPATIHALELEFDLEGRLARYHYATEPGRAPVARAS